MKRIRGCFLLFCVNFLGKSNGFTADIAQTFSIHCQYLPAGKCMKAVPPRKIRLEDCGQADINDLYRWRWTPEGQIQNLETGLCLEIMDYEVDVYTNTDMYLGICSHRNKLQKWICEHRYRSALKLYYTNLAHERLHARWKSRTDGNLVTVTQDTRKWRKFKFNDSAGAEMCDFDQRDHCLQTVAKIPTPENTCLVAVATKSVHGYAEVPISGKDALKDFTISMWIKTRFAKDMGNMGVFSYLVKDAIVLGFAHYKWNFSRIDFFDRGIDIQTAKRHVLFAQSYWVHVAIIRSVREATLSYYVNDARLHSENSVSTKTIPGTGTLRLGNSVFEGAKWFNGFVSQFNIFTWTHDQENIEKLIQSHHCCHDRLPHGNWLSWDHVVNTWTLHGAARADKGVECTSFEKMSDTWIDSEYNRQNCRTPLFVSDAQYIPDHHFSSSSWTSAGRAPYGRASKQIPKAWCPETRDENSYLQVDLGYVQKVTAIGTMLKLKGRHAKRIKVYYSENGIHWHSDGQVYEASQRLVPELNIVPLTSAVTTRYLRLYPTGCIPSRCCLTVEIFGCDPEIDQKISEPEDGCTGTDKPYILMYLPVAQHVTRMQLKARKSKKPIRSFYMYYMSWRQWIPYQVKGRTKVFKGNRDTSRPFTHILILPILTRLIKIFPIPYGSSVCSDFTFIGCHVPHDDFCTFMEVRKARNCRKRPMPQCSLGFVGNGRICQDLNECDIKTGAYCDRNSQCRNKHGSFSCDPCKNNFIGDGRICQTSCEAFGITCGVNSFCDLEQCKCHEGYIYNGTHCTEDPDYGKLEELPTMRPDEIDGLCPDGFFNCYGDVIGTLDKLKKATLALENFDYDECSNG